MELRDGDGNQIGATLTLALPPGEWRQLNDVFAASYAGERELAVATVCLSAGETVCIDGSLVDRRTGDPTTIPAQRR